MGLCRLRHMHPHPLPGSALVRPKQSHALLRVPHFRKDEVRESPEWKDRMGAPGNMG